MYNDQFTKHDEVGTVRHEADNTEQDGHTPAAEQESDHDAAAKSSEIRSISTIKWFSVNKGTTRKLVSFLPKIRIMLEHANHQSHEHDEAI